MSKTKVGRKPNLVEALVVIILSITILLTGIVVFKVDPHVPLLLAAVFCAIFAVFLGHKWEEIEGSLIEGIRLALLPMLIILLIGAVVGGWIAGGTVPFIIYWGLKIISPQWFLLTALIMCCFMSISIGSSWTTAGTLGVALMGIGYGMGIPAPLTAGAIVSGAYFGDKQSPLSDTTNFAPAAAGTTLYEHVNSMLYTTIPAVTIAGIIYAVLGFKYGSNAIDITNVNLILETLKSNFNLSPLMIIPLVILILIIVKKVPALIGMTVASLLGLIYAVVFQGASITKAISYIHYGYVSATGVEVVDKLLSRGGLHSMLWTISLMFISLALCGILERMGALAVVLESLGKAVKSVFGLVTATIIATFGLSFFAADPYLAMLLPAKTFGPAYDEKKIDRKVLSRSLEDAGTLVAPMVPWGTNGVFIATTLGVATIEYIPYYFLGILTPIIGIILAATGFGIFRIKEEPDNVKEVLNR